MSAAPDGFVEVRNAAGKLLFEYDPARQLVRIKPKGGSLELVDLCTYGCTNITRLIKRPARINTNDPS